MVPIRSQLASLIIMQIKNGNYEEARGVFTQTTAIVCLYISLCSLISGGTANDKALTSRQAIASFSLMLSHFKF